MNMHFQLNLSATEHVVAAKLRLYKLPQENVTTSGDETFDDIDRNETRIRISVYHYTKALKKFRGKYPRKNRGAPGYPKSSEYPSILPFSEKTIAGFDHDAPDDGRRPSGAGRQAGPEILENGSPKLARQSRQSRSGGAGRGPGRQVVGTGSLHPAAVLRGPRLGSEGM